MAYIKRTNYTVINNDIIKEEMLEALYELDTISEAKARQLVYYPVPMTLIRWGKYLTPAQISRFLVEVGNENGSNVEDDDIDNIGI